MKKMKVTAALMAALVLTTSPVAAASTEDVPSLFIEQDISSLTEDMKTPLASVTDGGFKLTLEQALAYPSRAVLICSVEGVTKEAKDELALEDFRTLIQLNMPEGGRYNGMQQSELEELSTATKKYYYCLVEGISNPDGLPFSIGLNRFIADKKYIEIPVDTSLEMLDLALISPEGRTTTVKITPMDIFVEKDMIVEYGDLIEYTDMYFRMEDDTIKTFNELFHWKQSTISETGLPVGVPRSYQHSAVAYEILDLSKIKGVILGNLEYDVSDTTKAKEVKLDDTYRIFSHPVVSSQEQFMVPLKDVIEKLGGEIIIDETGNNAVIQYRGSTIEIGTGKDFYVKDGVEFKSIFTPRVEVVNKDGVLLMNSWNFWECFRVKTSIQYSDGWEATGMWYMP